VLLLQRQVRAVSPGVQHVANAVVTAAVTAALGYFGFVAPATGAKDAQWECCALARELVEACQ
jgi:hypothetical protein